MSRAPSAAIAGTIETTVHNQSGEVCMTETAVTYTAPLPE